MKIWLVTIGEPLPTDAGGPRLLRHGLLAECLSERGHQVLWWTSSFDHFQKRQRVAESMTVEVRSGLLLRILRGPGYRKNRSLKRFLDHFLLARRFAREARQADPPDVIVASYPPVELCWEAVRYGRSRNVPVALDMRDAWPDIFLEMVPGWARLPARIALIPYFLMANWSRAKATAILGVTLGYVSWGATAGGRRPGPLDLSFPLACSNRPTSPPQQDQAGKFWDCLGIRQNDDAFTVCFFGSLARYFEIDTVFAAARRLKETDSKIRFVLCGRGDDFSCYQAMAKDCGNVIMPGWVGVAELRELMRRAQVGLAPYRSAWYFHMHIPNKVIEYLSGGLPVVSSLEGSVEALLAEAECGVTYPSGDPDALFDALEALAGDPKQRERMATNALRRFEDAFTAEAVYGAMADHLEYIAHVPARK